MHKHKSHELINRVLLKWLDYYLDKGTSPAVVTMPSCSGRQENMIITHAESRQSDGHLRLLTFDDRFHAKETGIDEYLLYDTEWVHYKCPDIFRKMLQLDFPEQPVAAWFDMIGGLTNTVWEGMQEVVKKQFADGSLLFVTLAIDNARGFHEQNHARQVYDGFRKDRSSRRFVTDLLLNGMVEQTGKYLRPCLAPYVYKNGRATFGVFGYIVGKNK